MTIITGGVWPINPNVETGTDLATHLNELVQAINSSQASASRPPMIAKGGLWAKTAGAADISIMFFDGAADHEIGSVVGGIAKFGGSSFGSGATASMPAVGVAKAGDLFYDTTTGQLMVFDGTAWKAVSSTAADAVVKTPAGAGLQTLTGQLGIVGTGYSPVLTLTDGASIAWDTSKGQVAKVTIAGNRAVAAPTNLKDGAFYSIEVIQDATGSHTLSWATVFKWSAGVAPSVTTTGGSRDFFTFRSDGTNLYEQGSSYDVK